MKKHTTILTLLLMGASPLVASEGWLTDFEQAKAEAESSNVLILANFTGSDWCPPCKMLDREVFSTEKFQKYAANHLVLFKADFPRNKPQSSAVQQQNEQLAETYGIQGFPTILLLNAEGKKVGRTGYRPGGAQAYIEHLEELDAKR